ncbi:hypothetical protein AMTRI_Chr09g13710 [Amborella trichopoda]|uniref:pectinesterase n=1 Tax=Amborella trichopoda TaxID=13333 RepID=U5D6Q2_AMBTC|nr:21 kDa protein [Amborella trichopoda]ERN17082.1 hypothetical protein AMTR_s00044p00081280 [Amborella trichopoda]|eukprot:XP_011627498.1 21 kDa protein [Amborella trichopoda]
MNPPSFSLILVMVLTATFACRCCAGPSNYYLRHACRATLYPSLCIRTLCPNSHTRSSRGVARAAISVCLAKAKDASSYISSLAQGKTMKRIEVAALSDCRENFDDVLDLLHRSLRVLRKLSAVDFELQMSNVQTWVSAALTNEDTCLDGFRGVSSTIWPPLSSTVTNVEHLTSNALALVNRLASGGP